MTREVISLLYLDNKGTKDDTAEDQIVEDAFKDVPFTVDLSGVDLVEKLHHYKGVEDDGVVFRRWRMEGGVPAAVNVKQFLSYGNKQGEFDQINEWILSRTHTKSLCD